MKPISHLLLPILCLATVTAFTDSLEEAERDALKKYTIENSVNIFSMAGVEKTKVGYQYWFADKNFVDGRTLKMSVVEPGRATHAPHTHEEDEFFFVLEGTAEFYLDGKTVISGPYASFYCPPGSKHGIRNVGDTELKYLVIKKYRNPD
jgi:mannose-6-phosphate isomerase-like protein (cupin superfamily)